MASLKNKFNRVGSDASQLQQFADSVCDVLGNEDGEFANIDEKVNEGIESGEINAGTKLYLHIYGKDDLVMLRFISNQNKVLSVKEICNMFYEGTLFNVFYFNDDDIDSESMVFQLSYSSNILTIESSSYDLNGTQSNFDFTELTKTEITPL